MSLETNSLKLATAEDADVVLELMREFWETTVYSKITTFDKDHVLGQFLWLIEAPIEDSCVVLLKAEDRIVGLIAMNSFASAFDGSTKIAMEKAFWIKPEYRTFSRIKLMLKAFYYWAQTAGYKAALVGKLRTKDLPESYSMRIF